jgi:hypothetical protein
MIRIRRNSVSVVVLMATTLTLGACASFNFSSPFSSSSAPSAAPPPSAPVVPPSLRPDDVVGRWGLASYHRDQDRARTEVAARGQCTQPYVINRSSTGVMMLGHDNPQVQDMTIKGSVEGKTYIGPGIDPAAADDREVLSFDGRVLILKWVDPEVAGRYGNMVLVRCSPEGSPAPKPPRPKKPKPPPAPPPQ